MMTWKQLRDALDSVLEPGEEIAAVHVAQGKMELEIVRYPEGTIVRTPVMLKEQEE
jgi:hypothetical protein